MKITETMILDCYDNFKKGKIDFVPAGMNPTSAKMTMEWLDSIINTGQSYNRTASLLQYELILNQIEKDYGKRKAMEAAKTLMTYCQQYNKKSHIQILKKFLEFPEQKTNFSIKIANLFKKIFKALFGQTFQNILKKSLTN